MEIRIPKDSASHAITGVASRELIRRILAGAGCRVLEHRSETGKPIEVVADKILRKGRIHIRTSCPAAIGEYVIHLHHDRRTLLKKHISLDDCYEVRKFANEYVIPTILRHRKLYRFRVERKDKWQVRTAPLPTYGKTRTS